MHSKHQFICLFSLMACLTTPAVAQTDYYNTDAGRPIRTEDAYPVERRAFELQLAPVRLERAPGGMYSWGFEPEFAFGFAPRTHIEAGFPLVIFDRPGAGTMSGLAGAEISVLHNLNVETALPALAIVADVLLPAGRFGPDKAYPSVKGIATKTFTWMRFHANGQYTFGEAPSTLSSGVHLSRWNAGFAADKTLPLRSLLVTAELVTEQSMDDTDPLEWSAATGVRYQLSPRLAVDAGVGARLGTEPRPWFITFGSAFAFGLPWYPKR